MSEELKQHVLKNGLLLGFVYVCISILKYIGGVEYFFNNYIGAFTILIAIIVPIYCTIKFRTNNGGYIDFKTAFSSCTAILLAAGFIDLVFQMGLLNVFDPQFSVELLDATIDKTVLVYESFKTDEEISELIELIEEKSIYSPKNMLIGYGVLTIGYTLFGLLVAAFTKNENQQFSE